MSIYRRNPNRVQPIEESYVTKNELSTYQVEISSLVSQFQQSRQEAESMFDDVRNNHNQYYQKILEQDKRIDALSFLLIDIQQKLEKLNESGEIK